MEHPTVMQQLQKQMDADHESVFLTFLNIG